MANEKVFQSRIQLKHDTEENWLKATNFIPKEGEIIIYDVDANNPTPRFKVGNGTTTVNLLPFVAAQADWNIIDENDSGYIKNKPDYDKIAADVEELSANVAYISETDNENIENPDINVSDIIIDSALSTSSANPVQNRVITQEINQLSEAIVEQQENIEELQESVEDIEYQDITTGLTYIHEDLPLGEKTVTVQSDGVFGNESYLFESVDLIPRKVFKLSLPSGVVNGGVKITRNDYTYYIDGTSTCTQDIFFAENANSTNIPITESLIGKTLRAVSFINELKPGAFYFNVYFYDVNGNTLTSKAIYVGQTALMHAGTVIVPENTAYMRIKLQIRSAGLEFNHNLQFYLVVDAGQQTSTLVDGVAKFEGTAASDIITMPYPSIITINAPLAEYIEYKVENAKGDKSTFLTPESFGAIGDGYADDSAAINLCLAKAVETKQTVFMAQKYLISETIVISEDGLNIIANDIVYTGSDTAIKISGQKNTLKVHSIKSSGVGISYRGDNNKFVCHNDVEVNDIDSTSHGIVLYNGLKGIYQNKVRFNSIKAGGSGTYGICNLVAEGDSWVTENIFYGGQIAHCDWAVYRIAGNSKLYNIQVEDNVQGGFYIIGYVVILYPRLSESARDGSFPYFKFLSSSKTKIYTIEPIHINEIDLSECEETITTAGGTTHPLTEVHFSTIYCPIMNALIETGEDVNTSIIYCDKAYIWGKRLIMTPRTDYRKVVTTEVLDTRRIDTQITEEEVHTLPQLPTKFVVNNVNTEIYLHASYCAFGFNKFEVEQANGFTCKIYDYDQNLIFDGTEQGDGIYNITIYKDSELVEQHGNYGSMWMPNDNDWRGLNQTWSIEPVFTMDMLQQATEGIVQDVITALPKYAGEVEDV